MAYHIFEIPRHGGADGKLQALTAVVRHDGLPVDLPAPALLPIPEHIRARVFRNFQRMRFDVERVQAQNQALENRRSKHTVTGRL